MFNLASEKNTENEGLRHTFQAIKDQRTFKRAPKLKPTSVQKSLAEQAVIRAENKLPSKTINKLYERYKEEGHYVNIIRYYPFPILAYGGSEDRIKELIDWGHTYAAIMGKIARLYRNPDQGTFRRFFYFPLMKFFSSHLLRLIEVYRTTDDLAGAHLGDDNLGGRSIEWNVGAVGGLDEGYLTAREVAGSWKPGSGLDRDIRPVEKDPVLDIRDALYWAYESFCQGNQIKPAARPFIASVEHDDLYGSTVSICERLNNLGEDVYLCFEQEISFDKGRLVTSSGHPIDLVYMDCHLEDLKEDHPILRAVSENAVAMDCSPFAHLVLRSKVILALLCSPDFLKVLDLDQHERSMLERHLMPSFLWRRKTFQDDELRFSSAAEALLNDRRFAQPPFPVMEPDQATKEKDEIVVKIAIGSVYGGSSVSVVEKNRKGYKTKEAACLIYEIINTLASGYTTLEASEILVSVKNILKARIKELVLLSLSRRLSDTDKENWDVGDAFWSEVKKTWEDLLFQPSENGLEAISSDDFIKSIEQPLHHEFNIDLNAEKSANKIVWGKLEKAILKALDKTGDPIKSRKSLDQMFFTLGHILADIQYQREGGGKILGVLMGRIKAVVNPNERITYAYLTSKVMGVIDRFFEKDLGTPLPPRERKQLLSILLEPYIVSQTKSINPVILQPYVTPDVLYDESGLHITNRIHTLFTKNGTRVFISGAQIFFLKDAKPDNRYKMTGSLWV